MGRVASPFARFVTCDLGALQEVAWTTGVLGFVSRRPRSRALSLPHGNRRRCRARGRFAARRCSAPQATAQCADSEVRNAFERTPYVVVLKFHVFIHISKSFNFRCALERILRYLTKTWFYTLNFKKNPCWWLSIGYWVIENDSVSDTEECWGMHYCGAPGAWNSAIFWTDDLDPI